MNRDFFKFLRYLFRYPSYLPVEIQIEITNRCNLACEMCPRVQMDLPLQDMSMEIFETTISRIGNPYYLILTGWGEPLMNPNFFQMANFAKKKLPQTGIRFTTNGTLLNSEYCKRIINPGIERVAISLDVISYNDGDAGIVHPTTGEILENIKELLNLRSKKRYPKVSLQTVIRPDSMQELISVIRFGADVGIDYLNLVRLDTRRDSSLIRPSLQEEFGISDMPRKRHDAWDSRYSQSMTSLSFFAWLVILIKSACVAWIQFILLSTGK